MKGRYRSLTHWRRRLLLDVRDVMNVTNAVHPQSISMEEPKSTLLELSEKMSGWKAFGQLWARVGVH
jgi:hypothetical protein